MKPGPTLCGATVWTNSRRTKILEQMDPRALAHRYEQEAKKEAA